ncbi:unnamed protein product, partial [Sphacelaria rigidula]
HFCSRQADVDLAGFDVASERRQDVTGATVLFDVGTPSPRNITRLWSSKQCAESGWCTFLLYLMVDAMYQAIKLIRESGTKGQRLACAVSPVTVTPDRNPIA